VEMFIKEPFKFSSYLFEALSWYPMDVNNGSCCVMLVTSIGHIASSRNLEILSCQLSEKNITDEGKVSEDS